MVKWIIAAILLLPLAEIAVFGLVTAAIGFGPALLLVVATSAAGFLLLRRIGRDGMTRLRAAVADNSIAGLQIDAAGLPTLVAGLLLFLPGFLTDLVGLALLLGPVRRWGARVFRDARARRTPADRTTIDLKPDEWQRVPERELQDRAKDRAENRANHRG